MSLAGAQALTRADLGFKTGVDKDMISRLDLLYWGGGDIHLIHPLYPPLVDDEAHTNCSPTLFPVVSEWSIIK